MHQYCYEPREDKINVPYHRGVKVVGSQFGPKFVDDPKRYYWHHETNQTRPSDELVSFANGKQFMTVRMIANNFDGGRFKKRTTSTPKRLLENYTAEVAALTIY
jgi:hypothetical protein